MSGRIKEQVANWQATFEGTREAQAALIDEEAELMNLSQLSDDELKQMKRDAERAHIVSFQDIPTLRKLIAAFENDLRQSGGVDREASGALGMRDKRTRT